MNKHIVKIATLCSAMVVFFSPAHSSSAVSRFAGVSDGSASFEIPTKPIELAEPVTNTGYGMVMPNYQSGRNDQLQLKTKFPFVNIAYKRFLWSELEPEEGLYDFQALEKWIAYWRNRGYRVGFGVMSTTDGKQGTPLWVFRYGVPGVVHMGGRQTDPVMWDEKYLDKLDNFITALGKKLNGGREIEFVDIRGIGMWGEMHFGLGIKGMWTQDELYDNGLSEDKLTAAYFRQMDSYKKAFANTNLFLNIAPDQEQIKSVAPHLKLYFLPKKNSDYQKSVIDKVIGKPFILPISQKIVKQSVALGIGLRFDGLSLDHESSLQIISGYFRNHCAPGGVVKCFYEFAGAEKNPENIRKMLNRAVSDYASYININFQELKNVDSETANILRDTARKIGHQFYLIKATAHVANAGPQVKLGINHSWMNNGNAMAPEGCRLLFSLIDETGNIAANVEATLRPPISKWMVGETINFTTDLPLPVDFKEGVYVLSVRMVDASGKTVKICLVPSDKDENYYQIARFSIRHDGNGQIIFRLFST